MINNSFLNKKLKNDYYMGLSLYFVIISFLFYFACVVLIKVNPLLRWNIINKSILSFSNFFTSSYYWTIVTYPFVHFDILNLIFLSIFFVVFGLQFERRIGSKEYLLFFTTCNIFTSACFLLTSYLTQNVNFPLFGSTPFVYAVLFLFSMMYKYDCVNLFFFLPVRLPFVAIILLAIDIVFAFVSLRSLYSVMAEIYAVSYAFLYAGIRMRLKPLLFFKQVFRGRR